MAAYSHSQLSTFEQCPQKYRFKYIDRIKSGEERTAEAFVGSLVHEVFQKLYEDLKYEKLNSLDELLEQYFGEWRRRWNPGVRLVKEGLEEANYRDYGARCIRNYYQRYYPFSQSQTLSTEHHLVFPLDSEARCVLQGYADRIARRADGTYEIHDYKTSGHLPAQAHADSDRQLPLYEIGLRALWRDVERVELVWHYVGLDSTLVSRRSPDQLAQLASQTVKLTEQIATCEEFPPVRSALCDWCEYRSICPLWKHVDQVTTLPSEQFAADAGVRLANEYAGLKTQADQLRQRREALREKIIAFATRQGVSVIQGAGVRVSVSQSTRAALPPSGPAREELERLLEESGLWKEASEVSANRCAELLNSADLAQDQFLALRRLLSVRVFSMLRVHRTGHMEADDDGEL
ncbi:MAG: RecB family exonuclease [Terriglobia bacterium]